MEDGELIARVNMVRGASDTLNKVLALTRVLLDTGDLSEKGALSLAELAKDILRDADEQHKTNCQLAGVDA